MINLRITLCEKCGHPIKWHSEENKICSSYIEKYNLFLCDVTPSVKRYENKNISLHSFECKHCGQKNSYTIKKCEEEKMCV